MSSHPQPLASDSVTAEIVQAIATERDADPTELKPPLYTVVDTEALNDLFAPTKHGPRCGQISFAYCGQRVTVRSDDGVKIEIEDGDGVETGTEIEHTSDRR
ncbi:HalOD1 output domain-containing protein [Halomontanus rarus]|uniref:HalOD1 output domain-containing protein n=1 Tax=Halomontanus rarus TaxID=3034020 RepID=UPI0023E7E808|nr:HalOD1 output domain-containing protein [Halovivax sp. TS33]